MYSQRRELRGRRMPTSRGKTLFQRVLALAATRPVFTASGHITLSGTGDVLSVHDANDDTHVLTQADTAKQVDPPAPHADFANQLCLTFVRASATQYDSNRPPAQWKFPMVPGATLLCGASHTSATGTQVRYTTRATGNGVTQYRLTGGATCYYAEDGVAIINVTAGGVVGVGAPTYSDVSYPDPSPNYTVRTKGTTTASGPRLAVPAGNDPAFSLKLGSDGTNHADFRWPFWFGFPVLTSSGRATVQQYIQQTYGMAA